MVIQQDRVNTMFYLNGRIKKMLKERKTPKAGTNTNKSDVIRKLVMTAQTQVSAMLYFDHYIILYYTCMKNEVTTRNEG